MYLKRCLSTILITSIMFCIFIVPTNNNIVFGEEEFIEDEMPRGEEDEFAAPENVVQPSVPSNVVNPEVEKETKNTLENNQNEVVQSVEASSEYDRQINLLTALGIIEGKFDPDENVTRKEFAVAVCKLIGFGKDAEQNVETRFIDVPSEDPASGSIKIASEMGIINGFGSGEFRPQESVTYEQAVKMLMYLLGYDLYAKDKGGYPSGYLLIASEQGLVKNVNGKVGIALDWRKTAKMLYNSLEVEVMQQTGYGNDIQFIIEKEKTLLTEKLKINKGTGIVTANHDTTLNGESNLKEDEIAIDKTQIYKIGQTNAKEYLGYSVTYYVQEDSNSDEDTFVFMEPDTDNNQVLTIRADSIVKEETNKNKIVYWIDKEKDDRSEEVQISLIADVIYNGKAYGDYGSKELKPKSGKVVLLDNNNDDIYDVVHVTSYETIIVNGVSYEQNKIYNKFANSSLPELEVKLDSKDYECMIIDPNGKNFELKKIKEWNVLSVQRSINQEEQLKKIIVNTEKFIGKISELDDNKITVSDKQYEISHAYLTAVDNNEAKTLDVDDEGTFYLDIEGKVAAVNIVKSTAVKYGFLFNAAVGSGVSEKVEFEILTPDNKFVIYPVAPKLEFNTTKVSKVIFDGKDYYSIEDNSKKTDADTAATDPILYNATTDRMNRQVIRYELNSNGEIYKLETAQVSISSAFTEAYNQSEVQKLIDNNVFRISGDLKARNFYRDQNALTSGASLKDPYEQFVDGQTIVYRIPETYNTEDDKEHYLGGTANTNLSNNSENNVIVYDSTIGNLAKVVVRTYKVMDVNSVSANQTLKIVDKIVDAIDEDGNRVKKLVYYENGNQKAEKILADNYNLMSVMQEKPSTYQNSNGEITEGKYKIQKGDVVRIAQNVAEQIYEVEIVYSENSDIRLVQVGNNEKSGSIISGEVNIIEGGLRVEVRTGIKYNTTMDPEFKYRYYRCNLNAQSKVFLYNIRSQKATMGTLSDIGKGDFIIMRIGYGGKPSEMIRIDSSDKEWVK